MEKTFKISFILGQNFLLLLFFRWVYTTQKKAPYIKNYILLPKKKTKTFFLYLYKKFRNNLPESRCSLLHSSKFIFHFFLFDVVMNNEPKHII